MTSLLSSVPKRILILGSVALLLAALLMARWIADWGLVTIHVKNAPLKKVIASIARQGHVRIQSSLDPANTISMDVDRVPVAVAIDILSIRADASWRLVYLAAKFRTAISVALMALGENGKVDGWTMHYYPGPPAPGGSGLAIDPRALSLQIEGPDQDLPKLLDQAAQKTGVMTGLPDDWNPTAGTIPKYNRVSKVIPALVSSARGRVVEFFFLYEHNHPSGGNENAGSEPQGDQGGRFGTDANPEWREQRELAQIQLLPPSERGAAKKHMAEMKDFFVQMKGLSPAERRAKWQQMMANPDFLYQMQDRQLLRQANQSPEQRINRAVNYLNNRATVQASRSH